MSGFDRATVDVLLTQALRDRALDVGDEAEFARKVASVATTQPPLRREALRWPVFAPRRGVLVLVTALLALTVLAAGLIGYGVFIRGPVPPIVSNGPILIADDIGGSWWADPTTFEEITAGVPAVPSGIQAAAWSRDGERLALDVQGDLEILDADSGERRPIARCAAIGWACTSGIRTRSLEWSPDGAAIAIANGARLVVIDVAGGQVRTLVGPVDDAAPRILASPSWSPDGRWIAFELDDTRLSGLGAMRQLHVISARWLRPAPARRGDAFGLVGHDPANLVRAPRRDPRAGIRLARRSTRRSRRALVRRPVHVRWPASRRAREDRHPWIGAVRRLHQVPDARPG